MTAFINWLTNQLANIINVVLMILPETPFEWEFIQALTGHPFWKNVNYFIPFDVIASIILSYVGAVAIWYGLRWLLRFVRYIQ